MNYMQNKLVRILRWSEKYIKTDMVLLTKNTAWPVVGQLIASASALILAYVFALVVSKETYGTYKFILSIPALFSFLLIPGLDTALRRSIAKGMDGDFRVALHSKTRWALLFSTVALCVSIYYWTQGNTLIGTGILIVSLFTAVSNIIGLYGAILAGKIMPKEGTAVYIISRFSTVCVLLFAIYFFSENVLLLIVATFIADTLVGYYFFKKTVRKELRNTVTSGEILNYGKHLSFMGVLSGFVASLDNLLVFHFLGATQLAIYAYTTAIPDQLKGPLVGLENFLFSRFARHKEANVKENLLHKFIVLFVCMTIIVISYWILAPLIYPYLFPKYTDAIFYSQIYALSLLAISFFPANLFLSVHKKIKEQYLTHTSTAFVQIVTMVIFITQWGLLGLIISRVLTRIYNALINVYFAMKN